MTDIHAGQLLCGGFQGTFVTPQAYHLIVEHHVSAMILSRKNAVNVEQMSKLIKDLQYIAMTQGRYKHPIMFAIDEEGGMMNSLFDPDFLTQYPGAMALAATGDPNLVYEISKAIAIEIKKIGFSIILGPVLDVVTKLSHQLVGVRSFGTTVDDVIKYGRMCAKGLQDGGLFTVGKHFPGIGNATVDSLLELPMLGESLDQLRHFNVLPFEKLIQEGLLDGISAAGCGVPNISPDETHACLSPLVINQLLRQDLNFDGFVISECLEMDALFHSIGLGQGVILAINAGCDLVMVCHDMALQNEAIESIKKAVVNGNLDEETFRASVKRIEKLQNKLPTWLEIFPEGELSAKLPPTLFKNEFPEQWNQHQKLSSLAYQKSITLIRDFNGALPLSKHLVATGSNQIDSILLLTPLLNPIYPFKPLDSKSRLFTGEEVFQKFGDYLSNHPISKTKSYNVLHTTYTANGLTPLHESLIEQAKIVIVLTSEASRNMYQIGIVKFVSILCGANPSTKSISQSKKPLIIVATSSPYDFFYNKGIGSAYLCCYDYTNNALKQLTGVLMGDCEPEGCVPGEKKFMLRNKHSSDSELKVAPKRSAPKRKWLVDEFDMQRDWNGLVKLWKNNNDDTDVLRTNKIDYLDESFYKRLGGLLVSTSKHQKHFVVRNSSLNILYGIIITWVDDSLNGHIEYLLVEKSKRLQSIGKNLHARAIKYLLKEKKCKEVFLGNAFPLLVLPDNISEKATDFFTSVGWNKHQSEKKHIMILKNASSWQVPTKILQEIMIVGVRFDICTEPTKLMNLLERSLQGANDADARDKRGVKNLYLEAIKYLKINSPYEVKIIIALEPTTQNVIGSIIIYTNNSQLSKFYPFIDQCIDDLGESELGLEPESRPLVGGIIEPIIDPSYSNLTEIFKYGLICSAITFMKSSLTEEEMSYCIMTDVIEDKSIDGIKEIGFEKWKNYYDYYDYYDKKTNFDKVFSV
ncbi:nagZ Beta-hexosaminidase [Candida maltosa Xu316]|uniref:Beta-n-acetylglucosaminidase, putative n=1 Tax=Candida maltosa (strain Xu316) TaxID=1245528 RepID=M3HFC4_CANMX|nr:Beta-n-acetylglucosaminidase, putative [Candida maltosa Xu316]